MTIRDFLTRIDLPEYADAFERQHVTVADLGDLSDDDLSNTFGMVRFVDRKRLKAAVGSAGTDPAILGPRRPTARRAALLAGRLPWDAADSEFEVMSRKKEGRIPPPTEFYPSIPPWVVSGVMAAIRPNPSERTQSVELLERSLRGEGARVHSTAVAVASEVDAGQVSPTVATPARAIGRSRKAEPESGSSGAKIGLGLLLAVAVVVGALWASDGGSRPESPRDIMAEPPSSFLEPTQSPVTSPPQVVVPPPKPVQPVVKHFSKPSWCVDAGTVVEHAICDDEGLSTMDNKLTAQFNTLRKSLSPADRKFIKREEGDWVKTREGCGEASDIISCIQSAFIERSTQLDAWTP